MAIKTLVVMFDEEFHDDILNALWYADLDMVSLSSAGEVEAVAIREIEDIEPNEEMLEAYYKLLDEVRC